MDDAWWPGGIGIFRDVDATPQTFSYSAADLGIDTTNTTNTTTTTTNDSNNSYNMYAVDNATAIPIAVIGQVRTSSNLVLYLSKLLSSTYGIASTPTFPLVK